MDTLPEPSSPDTLFGINPEWVKSPSPSMLEASLQSIDPSDLVDDQESVLNAIRLSMNETGDPVTLLLEVLERVPNGSLLQFVSWMKQIDFFMTTTKLYDDIISDREIYLPRVIEPYSYLQYAQSTEEGAIIFPVADKHTLSTLLDDVNTRDMLAEYCETHDINASEDEEYRDTYFFSPFQSAINNLPKTFKPKEIQTLLEDIENEWLKSSDTVFSFETILKAIISETSDEHLMPLLLCLEENFRQYEVDKNEGFYYPILEYSIGTKELSLKDDVVWSEPLSPTRIRDALTDAVEYDDPRDIIDSTMNKVDVFELEKLFETYIAQKSMVA